MSTITKLYHGQFCRSGLNLQTQTHTRTHKKNQKVEKDAVGLPLKKSKVPLRRLHRVFAQCWRTRARMMFLQMIFMFSLFKVTKNIKRQWERFRTSFAVVNMIKTIFVIKLRLHEGRRSSTIILLWFSSICFGEMSKFSQFVISILEISQYFKDKCLLLCLLWLVLW